MLSLENRNLTYKRINKTPLRITIHLSTPIVYPLNGIHLDALLTEIVARELFSYDLDRWQNQDKHVELPLPLEKTKGEYPLWKASIGFSSPISREHQDFWIKRTNDEFAGYKSSEIVWPAGVISDVASKSLAKEVNIERATGPANNPASGGFKSYYENRNLLLTDYMIFHAFGNKEEVERLLNSLKAIGKKVAIGFGKINRVEVDEMEDDYSLFTPNEKPARNLPVEDFPNLKSQIIASRTIPPYWSKRELVVCYAPPSPIPVWEWEDDVKITSFEESWFEENMEENDGWFDD
ncbi:MULTISPECIES: hypothetical protein [Oceanobacillus]|uniref:CRISPR-associated protein n=1 Tax=Oceanobacillus kimchii TaxID=746691 RepID=A0ABQ5TS80_9BACI|nr:hypothetical protein [Oceanobacillus kimchii]GLO68335.1 hypothetical protein MACH08_41190 [Oceanobacillus kimchii]